MDILVVDDEDDIRLQVCEILADEGYSPRPAATIAGALDEIQQRLPALAVIDVWFRHCERDGISLLEELLRRNPDIPVVMISGHSTVDMAVRAIKMGAYDFLTKPFALESLLNTIENALYQRQLSREHQEMAQQLGHQQVAQTSWLSASMNAVIKQVDQWAATDRRLLIVGERGSGKSSLALSIHQQSRRSGAAFLRHNCADYDREDQHHEVLFGSEDGLAGKLELAHQGTLLLENIENLGTSLQGKLTQFLQSQQFTRRGGQSKVKADVRILSISSHGIAALRDDPSMVTPFLDLIGLGVIEMPALRQRTEDLPQLVRQIKERLEFSFGSRPEEKDGTSTQSLSPRALSPRALSPRALSPEAFTALAAHSWPQNIHELENVIKRLYWSVGVMGKQEVKRAIGEEISHQHSNRLLQWRHLIAAIDLPLRQARELFERHYLHYHLDRFGGNVSQTAQHVNMDRAALHRKIRSLNLDDIGDYVVDTSADNADNTEATLGKITPDNTNGDAEDRQTSTTKEASCG